MKRWAALAAVAFLLLPALALASPVALAKGDEPVAVRQLADVVDIPVDRQGPE